MKTTRARWLLFALSLAISSLANCAAHAQEPAPAPEKVPACRVDWSASCGDKTGSGTGTGRTCEEAEEDAAAQAEIWVQTNCMGQPAAISLGDLNPELDMMKSPGVWKVRFKCSDPHGNSYAVTRSGCTFCEAYNAARAVVKKRFPQGFCCPWEGCKCCYQILQWPCCGCCHR